METSHWGKIGESSVRVLLVEDDQSLGEAVRDHLLSQGHAVDWMTCIEDAELSRASVGYRLVLLDLRLPDGSGIDFLSAMRQRGDLTPVIILTAHDQISDRIEGLNSGADDYLVKPFDLGELSARLLAVVRRYGGKPTATIQMGPVTIVPADRLLKIEGRDVPLSSREWAVLDALVTRPGAIVSKAQIEEALYAFGAEVESNTVEVYVSRLRKKLGKDFVQTIRGIGYTVARP
jgi:two-component system, OmpR family, response regulator